MNQPTTPIDPVRARRRKIARYTLLANRVGYLFYALAIATFVIGFAFSFNGAVSAIVIGSLIIANAWGVVDAKLATGSAAREAARLE